MRAPRLLLATTVPGTLERFLLPYADHCRRHGWRVDAVTSSAPEELGEAFDHIWTVPWRRDIEDPRNWTVAPHALRKVLAEQHYDVVHVHTPVASFVTRLVVGSLRSAVRPATCYTAHGFHFHPGGSRTANTIFRTAERLAGRWTDRLLVINEHDLREAQAHHVVPAERLLHVPGVGIDLEHYQPGQELFKQAAALREELIIGPHQMLFSVVAELQPGKDHLTVLRALAAASEVDSVLAFAGRGPEAERLQAEASRLGITHRLRMLGSLEDVRPLVLASRATVLASHREGLSRAVMESLALGVPVIGSRIRGIAELVGEDGGILVEPADVPGFAAALDAAAGFPSPQQLRAQLQHRLSQYSLPVLLDVHLQLYEQLRAVRAGARRPQPARSR